MSRSSLPTVNKRSFGNLPLKLVPSKLTINFFGKVRKVSEKGREYLVAPMTLINPGVLNGSKGPLLYPPEEVSKNPQQWNGVPIVVYHPYRLGQPVSASEPGIIEAQGVGVIRNAKSDGKLKAEGWFEVTKVKKVNPVVYHKLLNNQPIELSTGLHTDNEKAMGTFKGRQYTAVARNYKPDHLAILPDQVGACSLKDGCGVLVNSKQSLSNKLNRLISNGGPGSGRKPEGKSYDPGLANLPVGKRGEGSLDSQIDKYKAEKKAEKKSEAKARQSAKVQAKQLFKEHGQALAESTSKKHGMPVKDVLAFIEDKVKWEPKQAAAMLSKFAEEQKAKPTSNRLENKLKALVSNAAKFEESKHPRGKDGKFGKSSSSSSNQGPDYDAELYKIEDIKERSNKADEVYNDGVEKFKFPKILYHVTSGKNAKSIKSQGIKVGKPRETSDGIIRGVYLTDEPDELFYNDDFDPEDPHIIAIDTSKLNLRFDPDFYIGTLQKDSAEEIQRAIKEGENALFAYSRASIPKSAIKSVKKLPPIDNRLQFKLNSLTSNKGVSTRLEDKLHRLVTNGGPGSGRKPEGGGKEKTKHIGVTKDRPYGVIQHPNRELTRVLDDIAAKIKASEERNEEDTEEEENCDKPLQNNQLQDKLNQLVELKTDRPETILQESDSPEEAAEFSDLIPKAADSKFEKVDPDDDDWEKVADHLSSPEKDNEATVNSLSNKLAQLIVNVWSEEARRKAIEARQRGDSNLETEPNPSPGGVKSTGEAPSWKSAVQDTMGAVRAAHSASATSRDSGSEEGKMSGRASNMSVKAIQASGGNDHGLAAKLHDKAAQSHKEAYQALKASNPEAAMAHHKAYQSHSNASAMHDKEYRNTTGKNAVTNFRLDD